MNTTYIVGNKMKLMVHSFSVSKPHIQGICCNGFVGRTKKIKDKRNVKISAKCVQNIKRGTVQAKELVPQPSELLTRGQKQ